MNKIRKLLGDKYHLSEHILEDGSEEWVLFKRYDEPKIYFSKDNTSIMSSETNTIEELYEFAKKHHEIDEHQTMGIVNIVVAWIALIILIINMFVFKNNSIRWFIVGINFCVIIYSFISHIIWNKNWKVKMLEIKERLNKLK